MAVADPKICDPGGSGMFVPLFGGTDEGNWNKSGRAVLYGIIMCYCFLGTSIVSNFFMSAIEAITSKKGRRVLDHDKRHVITYFVWNDTVANLTLLALGSSAPEILLSIVEVIKLDFKAGDLGPSTIVGSAAFNLLCIISVAIIAIPSGEVRYVKGVQVYHVTVVFGLVAYLWLLVIVQVSSKDVVELWEAIMTLVFFFLLVVLAFVTDKYEEKKQDELDQALQLKESSVQHQLSEQMTLLRKKQLRKLLSPKMALIKMHKEGIVEKTGLRMTVASQKVLSMNGGGRYSLTGAQGIPNGWNEDMDKDPKCKARMPACYKAIVEISPPAGDDSIAIQDGKGKHIMNSHGIITFFCDQLEVKGCIHDTTVAIPVLRRNGSNGVISCKWRTERMDAVPNCDYQDDHGVLLFDEGVVWQEVVLTILPQRQTEYSECFQLILEQPDGGAAFNPNDDGKDVSAIMTITIVNSLDEDVRPGLGAKIYNALVDPELLKYGWELWKEQVSDACRANEFGDPPTLAENAMHVISFPWKIVFGTLAPPSVFLGGWLLFFVALAFVGCLTAFIADLAETFGCCMGWENSVTAILVVAPGTSLPDLFASKAAAVADDHADASIVNVTGSNSVNVFLGIGVPWTLAAIYWAIKGEVGASADYIARHPDILTRYPDGAFVVEAGTLSFSVTIFTCLSLICLGFLRIKRHVDGGELGGAACLSKHGLGGILVFLWIWYLGWNILKATSDDADVSQWISIAAAGVAVVAVVAVEFACRSGIIASKSPEYVIAGELIGDDSSLVATQIIMDSDMPPTTFADAPDLSGSEDSSNGLRNVVGKTLNAKGNARE